MHEFNENLPIYVQIMNFIKKRIVSGELNGGDKMPSVRELSSGLKVNPNTIQRAYQELEREELAYTKRGMGRFVTEDEEKISKLKKDMAEGVLQNFLSGMKELGFKKEEIINMVSECMDKGEI
jgi:DNA-binding transcriptional regulator YhcF (GntR family)